MDKIAIIKEIVKHHPSFGVGRGWATYTGGMADTGYWYWDKMVDVSDNELEVFSAYLKNQQIEIDKRLEKEKEEYEMISKLPKEEKDKIWVDKMKQIEEYNRKFIHDIDLKLIFGIKESNE